MKTCGRCAVRQSLSGFGPDKRSRDGFCHTCRACRRNIGNAYVSRNRSLHNQRSVEWNHKNKNKRAALNKAWAVKCKGHRNRLTSAYKKRRPEIANALNAKYRAARLCRTPKWLSKEDIELMSAFYIRAKQLSSQCQYDVDHIVPLQGRSVCGLHVPWNLQILKESTNCRKFNHFEGI